MIVSYQVEPWAGALDELRPLLLSHWLEVDPDQATVPLAPDWGRLANIDQAGALVLITARDIKSRSLVGYIVTFLSHHIHFSTTLFGFVDAFWLHPEYRKAVTGICLFTELEDEMKRRGVVKLIAQSKVRDDINIGAVYKYLGWSEAETVFAKVI